MLNEYALDPRESLDFLHGSTVLIRSGTEALPIIGQTYILNANYDLRQTLSLDVGCILSVNNSRAVSDSVLCIDYNSQFPVGDAIAGLLIAAGVPTFDLDYANLNILNQYKLIQPISAGSTESLIQTAGALASNNGYVIYQTNAGKVSIRDVAQQQSQYTLVNSIDTLHTYSITGQPEQPIRQLNVSYSELEAIGYLGISSNEAVNGNIKVTVNTTEDVPTATRVLEVKEYRNSNLVTTTTATSVYEQNALIPRSGSVASQSACFDGDKAKILSRTTITTSDNTEVLKEWLAKKAVATNPTSFTVTGVITDNRMVETWEYLAKQTTYTKTVYMPLAKVVPVIGDLTYGSSKPPTIDRDPLTEVVAERTVITYTVSREKSSRYTVVTSRFLASNLANATELPAEAVSPAVPLANVYENGVRLVQVEQDVQFNGSAPTFELFNQSEETLTTAKSFTLSAPVSGVSAQLDLGQHFKPNLNRLIALGKAYVTIANGRAYSCSASLPLPAPSLWPDIVPVSLAKVIESSARSYAYIIDTPAISYSEDEFVLSFTGIALGRATSNHSNFFAENIVRPTYIAEAEYQQQIQFSNLSISLELA
jgi:hypothetical protein